MTEASNGQIRVVIVDDHDLVREGLEQVLGLHDDLAVVATAGDVDGAVAAVREAAPDVVLLDLALGGEDGTEVARRLRDSDVRVLVVSAHDSSAHLHSALQAGADGYLLKSVSGTTLADGVRRAAAGETVIGHEFAAKLISDAARGLELPTLTSREEEVLALLADGTTNKQIAARLGVSVRTAQKHVDNLFGKLEVHDRAELVAAAFRRGLLQ